MRVWGGGLQNTGMFFNGFTLEQEGPLRLRVGGTGPAVLLLHGQRQTHAMWHAVAERLARHFTLVCPDLPPELGEAALAQRLLALMRERGSERFSIAGHDRGGHVACRMALASPSRIERLAVLEIVPVPEHMNRADMAYSLAGYPGCWFAQLHPKPEALVTHSPAEWFQPDLQSSEASFFHPEAVADYLSAEQRHATAAERVDTDSRALTAGNDEPPARRLLGCPLLVLWGAHGRIGGWYDPVQLWRTCSDGEVSGSAVEAGRFLAEEAPDVVAARLGGFFGDASGTSGPGS